MKPRDNVLKPVGDDWVEMEADSADFENNTITFVIPKNYEVVAGKYQVRPTPPANKNAASEVVDNKPVTYTFKDPAKYGLHFTSNPEQDNIKLDALVPLYAALTPQPVDHNEVVKTARSRLRYLVCGNHTPAISDDLYFYLTKTLDIGAEIITALKDAGYVITKTPNKQG